MFKVGDRVRRLHGPEFIMVQEGTEWIVRSVSHTGWISLAWPGGHTPNPPWDYDPIHFVKVETAATEAETKHEPPCPRCGHKAAPEHVTAATVERERPNQVISSFAFGRPAAEVVKVTLLKAQCWWCETAFETEVP